MFNVKDFEDEFILVCFIEDEYCVQYCDKWIEMFCKYYDVFCCIICVIMSYKQCIFVFFVEDMVEGICNSGEIVYIIN